MRSTRLLRHSTRTRRYLRSLHDIGSEVVRESREDDVSLLSAALVYYALLSIVPLLVLLLALPGLLLPITHIFDPIVKQILATAETVFGPQFSATMVQAGESIQRRSGIATAISLIVLVFSASAAFRYLKYSFRKIWKPPVEAAAAQAAWRAILTTIFEYAFGVLMVLMAGALLLLSVVIDSILQLAQNVLDALPGLGLGVALLNPLAALGIWVLVFALLFKYMPPTPVHWRDVWLGALLCAIGWTIAKWGLIIYIVFVGAASLYGAVGTLLAAMGWMYFGGEVLFYCAELCKVLARRR